MMLRSRSSFTGARRVAGGEAAFDATTLANLIQWHRSDEVTLDTGAVSSWADKSSASKDATQATSGNRPGWSSGAIAGRDAVTFNGTDQWLTFAGYVYGDSDPDTFIIVLAAGSTAGASIWFSDGGTTSGFRSTGTEIIATGANRTPAESGKSQDFLTSGWNILAITFTGGTNVVRLNGKVVTDPLTPRFTNTTASANIGRRHSGDHFNGSIGEIIRYSEAKITADLETAEAALAAYYGVTLYTP